MGFNTGLSGLRASSVDLDVTGNNIANASTVGFKSSQAQFGDLYASGFLSAGTNPIGDGVRVQDVKQNFGQGNISFTDNGLDLAINGDGFFVLNNGGEVRYSRAGQFGVDKDGFVTNNQNMRVQGFVADEDGNLSGIRGDLQVETDNLAPRRTTNLRSDLNLDSRETVLERRVADMGDYTAPAGSTGFPSETFEITYADGSVVSVPINAAGSTDFSAADVVDVLNGQDGLSASATTTYEGMSEADLNAAIAAGNFSFDLAVGGVTVPVDTTGVTDAASLVTAINNAQAPTISASLTGGNLRLIDNRGNNVTAGFTSDGPNPAPETTVGTVRPQADREITDIASTSGATNLTDSWNARNIEITNQFNPLDQRTYNHATSTTVYDSLGNSHEMTQFYVKQPAPGNGVGVSEWSVYLQIDGEFVAGTDQNPYQARFDQDGELQSVNGDPNGEILISDWTPKDADGTPNGADGPPGPGENITTPIPEPPTTSAFVLDLGNTTQYGSNFGVNDQRQNGYATGRLSGLDVSDQGVLFARYTNGQSQSLGQVALASFNNTNGLSPVGETSWVETFESGQPIIGAPDTGTLGAIKASSIEESNVDLSAELVNLIIAQRNYQANAKTIETSDAVTQTIINLR
ncbi:MULTISPECIES: flagellar hook protein FlgE [unclassified Marinobacter]|jgi:flagellar hook protein FlgE|uniref:flagellar hook protein FlgE n=1 Tax=unclassified Marinobacter TaxID=83889 RepID=UPI000C8B7FE6|nr:MULTISPECIES: flagellar hook protein FlgE [unclassified Marinobacter]MAB50165.1 flagellar biosynthesis protein FlgE [Marinobacter sp.]RUT74531.1 flagellar hook protein FlgE [Marinobacter sp. NP-6]|tara:strand:+ start:1006 stop:2904 length:1899 start_codon:yes stop_codon:yes gene_type:complete